MNNDSEKVTETDAGVDKTTIEPDVSVAVSQAASGAPDAKSQAGSLASTVAASPVTTVAQPLRLTEMSYTYTENDSMFGLFLQFGCSVANIRRWNNFLSSPRVGQTLKLWVMQ
ncbi:LysM peptidoglycan-binding domain-containing protein [Furfurilactobacillus sp. WILCCON 0119]